MAACDSLEHIFANPLPENPTLIESLTQWNQKKSMKPIEVSSFTEIFGELHFKDNDNENKNPSQSDALFDTQENKSVGCPKNCDGFSSKNAESLQLCTEELGSESSDDVEVSVNVRDDDDNDDVWKSKKEKEKGSSLTKNSSFDNQCMREWRRSRTTRKALPPPISCLGRTGMPCVRFKSYRHDGRFVLKMIRIPTQELLHARREDGRLRLHFVQPDKEIPEEEEVDAEDDL